MTWLVMRFSLDKKGGKADGLGEADGLKDWMRLKSGVRMTECKNVRKDLGRGLPCFQNIKGVLAKAIIQVSRDKHWLNT